ncbi:MAG: hypothetical protein JST55_16785 [Bacteroidetes bacterium]|nr:hypothetical protein [Bacteroidota bacterium]
MKNIAKISFAVLLFLVILKGNSYAQVDLVEMHDYIYTYLERMYNNGIIQSYNSSISPISRGSIIKYLSEIRENQNKISATDKSFLKKYLVEYNVDNNDNNEISFLSKPSLANVFNNEKQKYLYIYKDSTFNFYLDGLGNFTERIFRGDSLGNHKSLTGELGIRFRANYNDIVAAYLQVSNGDQLSGTPEDFEAVKKTNPKINATGSISDFTRTFFDRYEGYLRYQAKTNWVAVSVGRYGLSQGAGFIDNLFMSKNSIPFDFVKLDLNSKIFRYSYLYGSLRGDSLGKNLDSKSIASHRLDINVSNSCRIGFFESIIISNSPFSFTFLNPISFLTSAEFNKASQGTNKDINNSLLGFDVFVKPANKLSLQGSLLVDDLKFSTLFTSESSKINKFGIQGGAFWTDAFTVPNLNLKLEYTRLSAFVYSHSSNKSTYTNWDYSLGHALPPNSDEIAAQLEYPISSRLKMKVDYKFQRSADGFVKDANGNIIENYGGEISNSTAQYQSTSTFLKGDRKNRNIVEINLEFEPIKQYYININYVNKIFDNIFESRSLKDNYFTVTAKVEY